MDLAGVKSLIDRGYADYRRATDALEESRKSFRAALAQEPANPSARFALAVLDLKSGELDTAEQQFADLLRQNPAHADALYYLGLIAAIRRDEDLAATHYSSVLRLNPQHKAAREQVAKLGNRSRPLADSRQHSEYPPEPDDDEMAELIAGGSFYDILRADGSALSRQAVSLVDDLELDVRARRSAFIERYLFLIFWLALPIVVGFLTGMN